VGHRLLLSFKGKIQRGLNHPGFVGKKLNGQIAMNKPFDGNLQEDLSSRVPIREGLIVADRK